MVFERGIIVQGDYPSWASVVNMLGHDVLPDYHWFWGIPLQRKNAGEILGQPYSLSIIIPWFISRVLSIEWTFKLIIVVTYLVLAYGVFLFVVPMTEPWAAALASYLCVLEHLWAINHGMWYNSLSIGLAFWFFIALRRLVNKDKLRDWLIAIALLSAILFAHPTGTVMAFAGWLGFSIYATVTSRAALRSRRLLQILTLPAIAICLAFPQIAATLSANSTESFSYDVVYRYNPFSQLKPGLDILIILVALLGIIPLLKQSKRCFGTVLVPLIISYAICRNLAINIPVDFPLKTGLVAHAIRFKLVVSALLMIPFALGLKKLAMMRHIYVTRIGHHCIKWLSIVLLSLTVAGGALFGLRRTVFYQPKTLVTAKGIKDYGDFQKLCNWITANVDHQQERIYVEDTFSSDCFPVGPTTPLAQMPIHFAGLDKSIFTHYTSLFSFFTPCQQVNGFAFYRSPFGPQYCSDANYLFRLKPKELTSTVVQEAMWKLNCRHIVVFSSFMHNALRNLTFLEKSATFGRFSVFSWADMEPHYAWTDTHLHKVVPAKIVSPLEYSVDLRGLKNDAVYVSQQYHRNWQAYIGRQRISIEPWNALMKIQLPLDISETSLVLRYCQNRLLSTCIPIFTICTVLIFAACMFNKRSFSNTGTIVNQGSKC